MTLRFVVKSFLPCSGTIPLLDNTSYGRAGKCIRETLASIGLLEPNRTSILISEILDELRKDASDVGQFFVVYGRNFIVLIFLYHYYFA